MYEHSIFFDAGVGLFKEKKKNAIDPKYNQYYGWISPGGRYRLKNRFSIIGNFRLSMFPNVNKYGSVNPELFSLTVKFEAPIIFKETDTEAIRTLVFMEKKKEGKKEEQYSKDFESDTNVLNKFEKTMADLDTEVETFDYKKEKDELIRRREKVESMMEEIEKLLKEENK